MRTSKGFTLVEIVMAVVLIGIITAAAFVFLRGGTRAAEAISDHSATSGIARIAATEIESLLENAAYPGDLYRISEPVLEASSDRFTFISNTRNPGESGPEDEITISSSGGTITVVDGNGENLITPVRDAEIAFYYSGSNGTTVTEPASVRAVSFTISMAGGLDYNGSSYPYNLGLAGLSEQEYADVYLADGEEPGRWTSYVFEEDFESAGVIFFEDQMEGALVWEPVLEEDFEQVNSWTNNWQTWSSNPVGRVERYNDASLAYEGTHFLGLDCSTPGSSDNMAIWTVDLSSFAGEQLRLHYYWREFSDEQDANDGVFLPDMTEGYTTVVDLEDFSDFRNGNNKDWTYWTNDYGRIVVTDDYPTDGNYVNMDSRRNGGANLCRIMNSYDLSSYSTSSSVWLQYDFTDRGDENNAGDFIGIMGGAIDGTPVAQVGLNPASYSNGVWITREVDLDLLAPAGYNWSDFRIVFAQQDNYPTISSTSNDGISIDNVRVFVEEGTVWSFINRMIQAPSSFPAWEEAEVDLDAAASAAGIPLSSDFNIGFGARNTSYYPNDGIVFDKIAVEQQVWGMEGWTHGVWDSNTVDEWEAVNNPANANGDYGTWYYAVNGDDNYGTTATHAWLEAPEIDYTAYYEGDRIALAFFHKYDFNGNSGCNVKVSADDGATWTIIAPYYGYYKASVPGLDSESGWTGTSGYFGIAGGGYQFAVFDMTEYAGETVRVRMNYGIQAGDSGGKAGWIIDGLRTREQADWPQSYNGTPDWCGYVNSPDNMADPNNTPNGTNWAGNDMYNDPPEYETEHASNTFSLLVSPPVTYPDDNGVGDGIYSYIEFTGCPRIRSFVGKLYLLVTAYQEFAPPTYYILLMHDGYQSGWGLYRYRIDNLSNVWTSNKTVVFRWALDSNSWTPRYGGWNLDNIRCFTTNTYLHNLENGVIVPGDETDSHEIQMTDENTITMPPSQLQPSCDPIFSGGSQYSQERI